MTKKEEMAKKKGKELSPNQLLRQQRTSRYFIDAAKEIARDRGLEGITIREVAKLAGYNSATIYNYFENVQELIALTAIDMIQPWIRAGSRIYSENTDVLDQYICGWKVFCEYAFREPEGFAYIYSVQPEGIGRHFQTYNQLFGSSEENSIYRNLYDQASLKEQEDQTIRPCIEAGYIDEKDAPSVYECALLLFDGLIWRTLRDRDKIDPEDRTHQFMIYFLDYLQGRLCKRKDLSKFLK